MTATMQTARDEPFIPVRQKTQFVYLMMLDGKRCIASNHYGACGLNHRNKWAWIVGALIQETGCDPEDVHCVEGEDGDVIEVGGKPMAYLEQCS